MRNDFGDGYGRRSRGSRYGSSDYQRARGTFPGWYPGAYWAGAPMFGWGGMEGWGWPSYGPVGPWRYPADFEPRRTPRESAAYGRGGDEAARRWAERYGYDVEFSIRPRHSNSAPHNRGYDRDWTHPRRAGW
jgi:hypothetical protein